MKKIDCIAFLDREMRTHPLPVDLIPVVDELVEQYKVSVTIPGCAAPIIDALGYTLREFKEAEKEKAGKQ